MTAVAVAPSPLWRLAASRGAPRLAGAGLLGRIAMGMIPLALILAVAAQAGSYAAAGAITAAYALGVALVGPLRGRLADRLGARPVLLATGSLHAGALAASALLIQLGALGAPLALGGFLIGATLPPTGPVMRTIWDRTLADEELRRTAMAVESVALDVGLLTGPLLVAAIALIAPAEMALPAAAALTVISCVSLAAAPAARTRAAPARRDWLGALRPTELRVTLAVSAFAIGSLFPVEVAVVAFASEQGSRGAAGLLLSGFSISSALAGLLWATRRGGATSRRQLAGLLAAMAVAFAALAATPGMAVLAAGLLLAGAAVTPMLITQFDLIRTAAPPGLSTEAFSWTSSLGYGGGAAAAALAGVAIERYGASAGFIASAAMAALAATIAVGFQARAVKRLSTS